MSTLAIPVDRAKALRRGRILEFVTIGWNSLEAIVSIVAGLLAGSIALVGFGLDSVIETTAGAALLWRLGSRHEESDRHRERAEKIALTIVGWSFLALAAYVAADAVHALWKREAPEESIAGIVIASLSLIAMPVLAHMKRKVAAQLSSAALKAESRQTDICAYLSAVLLGGLILNAVAGWWWADPAAALIMVPIIAREGVQSLRGESCGCECHSASGCDSEGGSA